MKSRYNNFSPENVKEQVNRMQEFLYEFIKGLSKLKRDQDEFHKRLKEHGLGKD